MKLAKAKRPGGLRRSVQLRFGGYDALGTEGALCDMENMTSEFFPELASRPRRRHVTALTAPRGMGAGDALYWADGRTLVYNGTRYENALGETDGPRRFAQLGDILTIWPDGLAFDTASGTFRPLSGGTGQGLGLVYSSVDGTYSTRRNRIGLPDGEAVDSMPDLRPGDAVTIAGNRVYPENDRTAVIRELRRGRANGWGLVFDDDTFRNVNVLRLILTSAVAAGDWYADIGCTDHALRLKNVPAMEAGTVFVRFAEGTEDGFAFADVEKVMALPDGAAVAEELEFTKALTGLAEPPAGTAMLPYTASRTYDPDHVPAGAANTRWTETVTVRRAVPALDAVFAHDNRLFGAAGDTVYASKWGDPFNWNVFEGLASDSFATDTGTPGAFTGGISYGGYPRFFKEDRIFTLYGDFPAEYQLTGRRQPGVMAGAGASLAEGDGRLFYLSPQGPCAFAGGEPALLAGAFGVTRYQNGVGASDDRRYWLAMEDMDGRAHQFVYDIRHGLWMREDGVRALSLCRYDGGIWRLDADGNVDILGRPIRYPAASAEEAPVEWFAEFGDIAWGLPGKKRVTKLLMRLALGEGCAVRVRLLFDGERDWRTAASVTAPQKRSVLLPVVPRRFDHFRLRLEGTGECRLSSLAIETADAGL